MQIYPTQSENQGQALKVRNSEPIVVHALTFSALLSNEEEKEIASFRHPAPARFTESQLSYWRRECQKELISTDIESDQDVIGIRVEMSITKYPNGDVNDHFGSELLCYRLKDLAEQVA